MIDKISIIGLWNERNYRIKFVDGNLILVGENGSGKTTVLRIIHSVLSRNWIQLYAESFVRIELISGEETFCIQYNDLHGVKDYYIYIRDFPEYILYNSLYDILRDYGEWITPEKLIEVIRRSNLPEEDISRVERVAEHNMDNIPVKILEANDWIANHNELPIIYLPTYRRSERYPQKIDYLDSRIKRHRRHDRVEYDTLFAREGMNDVHDTIMQKIDDIRNEYNKSSFELNIKCFKGILTREYQNVKPLNDEYMNPDSVSMILSSINGMDVFVDNISKIKKQLLKLLSKDGQYDEYDTIVAYFYQMLIERYEHLKEVEEPLEAFIHACNKYLSNKKIQYYPNNFTYDIVLEYGDEDKKRSIDLNHLSSGEKQLVSLFSSIYLSTQNKCMVIIDEPEISLSVEWQESILEDIIQSGKCGSLIVATQSPFIFNNSLKPLAKSLDSFLTVE